jgi:hypothetical protein
MIDRFYPAGSIIYIIEAVLGVCLKNMGLKAGKTV